MLCLLQFAIICATLAQYSFGAPWDINNDIKEFDIEWQCEQFCDRLNGQLDFNSQDSSCVCYVDKNNHIDYNGKYLEHKLNDIGLNFKIIDHTKSSLVKRQVPANENHIPHPEHGPQTIAERLQKLREKLQVPKKGENKIITAPEDTFVGAPHTNPGQVEPPKIEPPKVEPPEEVPTKIEIPPPKNNDKLTELLAKIEARRNKNGPPPEEPTVGDPKTPKIDPPKVVPPKEEPPKQEPPKVPENPPPAQNDRLDEIRLKLAALRNKPPPEEDVKPVEKEKEGGPPKPEVPPTNNNRLIEIRERLAALRNKNAPHHEETEEMVVGNALSEEVKEPPKPEIKVPHVSPTHNDRLNEIRERLAAIRNKNLPPPGNHLDHKDHKSEPVVGDPHPHPKPLAERLKELRERMRLRMQNRNHNNLPNQDGHVEDQC